MNRTLITALVVAMCLASVAPAHAMTNCRKSSVKPKKHPLAMLALPLNLFVRVNQAPATLISNSLTGMLRQILIGQPAKKSGMPMRRFSTARI